MTDHPWAKDQYDSELVYAICLVDALHLIAFADSEPTQAQIDAIQLILDEEPALQSHHYITNMIADSLKAKLSKDFSTTADRILCAMNAVVDDEDRRHKILSYSIRVAMLGHVLPNDVLNLLARLTKSLNL